jgi:mannose-6-phosphate isomerase-like protein (cupin superfamily)
VRTVLSAVLSGALLTACAQGEAVPPVSPPPPPPSPPVLADASLSSNDAAPFAVSSDASPAVLAPPVLAKLVDVSVKGVLVPVASRCDVVFVAVAKGAFSVAGQSLLLGDVLMTRGTGALEMKGQGLAAVATRLHDCRDAAPGETVTKIARAGEAKDLAWAGGAMHAHLDLEKEVSPEVYVGRLEGTAAVAEHDHGTSWEVLFAIEGSGTFTLDGIATHIVGPTIVAVPAGRKHSWQPDSGSKLVAVQLYAPPGPEQRFKTLASAH